MRGKTAPAPPSCRTPASALWARISTRAFSLEIAKAVTPSAALRITAGYASIAAFQLNEAGRAAAGTEARWRTFAGHRNCAALVARHDILARRHEADCHHVPFDHLA